MAQALVYLIIALVVLAALAAIFAAFWRRASRETSLIRTGLGGRRVAVDGGVVAIPWFHDVARVNMQTLRLEVRRSGEGSLITKDRLRVDAGVEFYVSVAPEEEAIARAAQTLGDRTFDAAKLQSLIEGKLVDALRAVAARMTMDELHENRADFVREVRDMLSEPLARNGLTLEAVSLAALDQTPFSALDENNAFNAVGMRKLAEVIARSKKERAEIDREAEVAVHLSAMEASKRRLEIDLEEESARIRQAQELERLRADQLAAIAARKAESERTAAAARIEMEEAIRGRDIARETALREAEIAQRRALQSAETARIVAQAAESTEEARAQAEADLARADAAQAAAAVDTARARAEAERRRELALIETRRDAETAAQRRVAAAKAEADAALELARRTAAEAKAEAEADALRTAALRDKLIAEAEGRRALNEADNVVSAETAALRRDLARIEATPEIVAQMVKPAEKIESIRINHLSGLGRGEGGSAPRGAVEGVIDSLMEAALQMPTVRKLGEELGQTVDAHLAQRPEAAE